MPTFRQLEYLVAVADHGHFGRAARLVNVSQPTLSQQIKTLEARLGVTLIDRDKSSAELTPIGRDIAARARRLLADRRELHAAADRSKSSFAGTIRMGVSPTFGPYVLPPIVAKLHAEKPDLKFHVREGIPDEQAMELARGKLDVMVGPGPLRAPGLSVQAIGEEPLFLVAAKDHPLAKRSSIGTGDLSGWPLLSLDPRHHFHRQTARICDQYGMELLHDYEGTSLDSLQQMVGSGLGLSILPACYIASDVGGRAGVRVLEVEKWSAKREIVAAWREGAAYESLYTEIMTEIGAAIRVRI